MEDIDGGLHPAVDGQSLGERWNRKATDRRQWKTDGGLYPAVDEQGLGDSKTQTKLKSRNKK